MGINATRILRNKLSLCILSALFVSLLLTFALSSGFLGMQSLKASDLLYSEHKASAEIIIITIDDESITRIGRWPWDRSVYAEILPKLRNASVVGIDVSFAEPSNDDEELAKVLEVQENIIIVAECIDFSGKECNKWLLPIFNSSFAAANIYVDNGIARSVPGEINGVDSLSKAVSERYLNSQLELDDKNYIYFHEGYQKIPFYKLLENNFDESVFEDKVVLIGATANNLHDEQNTPVGVLPGVEIHANAVQNMISQKSLHYQSKNSIILFLILASLATAAILYILNLLPATIITIVLIISYLVLAIIMFGRGKIMNIIYPLLSSLATYILIIATYYTMEAKEHKWMRSVFSKYVSDNVAKEIMEKGADALHLKGTKRTVTVLFADVRGFTSMSEKLQPEQVVSLLNRYLSKMTDIVFKHGGTLDKYVGDEIMATYNVPLDQEDHALAAVKTALDMQAASKKLGKGMKYGIGINTAPAIVGNIGSKRRLDYTVIGDSINLGARLCSNCEGGHIMISESTYDLVKEKVRVKSLGSIKVKGKEKPIKVYDVLGLK